LKLRDVPRVLYLFEMAQPLTDTGAVAMLSSLFANDKQDLIFLQDETHLVLIKAYESYSDERAGHIALTAVDTMLSELMIPTRVGYSTPKESLPELFDAKREAALALRISAVFQEEREVASYSRLGIARLIYELPKDLCEQFLREVFGEKLPQLDLDEEMQVTIRLFFENNLNISETARQLYLHRNTLVYRLERFEKLTGLDIRKFEDAMTFRIAMMVLANVRRKEDEI
jgi:carbohydrate diacid regulator